MYHFHLVSVFSAIINSLLAIAVIYSNPRRNINQVIFILGLMIVDWNVGVYFLAQTSDPAKALLLFRQSTLGVFFVPAAIYHLTLLLANQQKSRYQFSAPYAISAILAGASFTHYGAASGRQFGDIYRNTGGPVYWLFYIWLASSILVSLSRLLPVIRGTHPGTVCLAKFVALAAATLGAGLIHDSLHVLGLNHYPGTKMAIMPYGTLAAAIYGLLLGYGLLSEQILDIRVSIGRNAATLIRLSFLLGTCYLILLCFAALMPGTFTRSSLCASLVSLLISTVITIRFFPKLLGNLSSQFGRRIIGDRLEYHDKVLGFTTEYRSQINTFSGYLEEIAELIYDQFALSTVGVTVFDGDTKARGSACRPNNASHDWDLVWGEQSALRSYFKSDSRPYVDIREGPQFGQPECTARDLMRAHGLALAFPIETEKKKRIGLLVVAHRKDGKSLNKLDAEVLSLLCQHIATRAERVAIERNEELQRANEAKDRFLASVNHEIRNPLNGITGVAQMLKEYCTEGRSKYLIGTLQSCTDQLRTTMDDVLDFNRIGPDVADNHPAVIDIIELVRSTTSSYDISGAQLVFDRVVRGFEQAGIQESAVRVWCDGGKFSHILMNYITNALKYGIPPGAHVQIRAEFIAAGLARITLAVTSTGPTLSHEELISLFTPLTRGRRAQETKAHGMGLGLALCKKLALAMGGNVGVESAHGQTTFWFAADFPLADSSGAEATPGLLKVTGRHALAVEDEPYNRLVLGYHLNRFGISAVWAEDGQTALAAAQNRSFDLIITDWILPDMDGAELLTQLRKKCANPLPPVIVVSAYSTASKQATGLTAGATAFVSKPIDEGKLAEAFAACKLGPAVAGVICDEIVSGSIDLSALKRASTNPNIIESFLREIEESHSKLAANWQSNPRSAVSLAHRLKGQMLLVRAKDCADLLALLERALTDGRSADAAHVLASVQSSFSNVTYTIRALLQQAPQQG